MCSRRSLSCCRRGIPWVRWLRLSLDPAILDRPEGLHGHDPDCFAYDLIYVRSAPERLLAIKLALFTQYNEAIPYFASHGDSSCPSSSLLLPLMSPGRMTFVFQLSKAVR